MALGNAGESRVPRNSCVRGSTVRLSPGQNDMMVFISGHEEECLC